MQRNKMFENFTKRVISVILICAMCITSLWLTDVNFADDSVEADDFDIPAEEGTYFFDGLSYKKIDETNPFTKEMYDLAVSSLDDNGDYEVDEVIHNPDQCSIYNKDELDALFYVYNHNSTSENSVTTDNENGGYLKSWSEDDWKFMRTVLQADLFCENGCQAFKDNPDLSEFCPSFYSITNSSHGDSRGIEGNYYYVIRIVLPYDNCGNLMINSVITTVHSCFRDTAPEYLDEVFADEDNFYKSGLMRLSTDSKIGKYNIIDKTPHIAVNDNMVVISRIQQKDNKKHESVYYYGRPDVIKKDRAGNAIWWNLDRNTYNCGREKVFEKFPSNLMFLLSKYVDVRRYYSPERGRKAKYNNPSLKISYKPHKMSSGTPTIYGMQEYFDKCDEYVRNNSVGKYCFDWTPVTSSEVICLSSFLNNSIDLYREDTLDKLSEKEEYQDYPDIKLYNANKKAIKKLEEFEHSPAPETFEDNELSDFADWLYDTYRRY